MSKIFIRPVSLGSTVFALCLLIFIQPYDICIFILPFYDYINSQIKWFAQYPWLTRGRITTNVSFPGQKPTNLSIYWEKPASSPHHSFPSAKMFSFVTEIKTEASEMEKKKKKKPIWLLVKYIEFFQKLHLFIVTTKYSSASVFKIIYKYHLHKALLKCYC